jgi:site-specific DNA recombinase
MVAEHELVEPLARFFAQRVFGSSREIYLAAAATTNDRDPLVDTRRAELAAEIDDLSRRQENLINELERLEHSGDPDADRAWREGIQRRFASTVAERRKKSQLLAELGREEQVSTRHDLDVLADVPQCDIELRRLSDEQQRRIYDAFHLELRFNTLRNEATIRVTVTRGVAQTLAAAVGESGDAQRPNKAGIEADASIPALQVWDAFGAPPGTRTPNPRIKSPLLCQLS